MCHHNEEEHKVHYTSDREEIGQEAEEEVRKESVDERRVARERRCVTVVRLESDWSLFNRRGGIKHKQRRSYREQSTIDNLVGGHEEDGDQHIHDGSDGCYITEALCSLRFPKKPKN